MVLWIPVFVLAVVLDILVVQPLTIYCRVAIDYSFVGQETHQIVTQLARISKVVLLRSFGVVKDANALIQYVNPACRAARMFPTLPICKLLMTLNDSDIKFPEHSYYRHVLWRQVLSRLYGVVAYLPLRLQTLIIDWVITALFYCLLVTLYYIGLINTGLVVVVVLGLAFYFCYVEGRIYLANHRVEGADDNMKKAPLGEEGQQPSLLKQAVTVGKVIVGTNIDDKTELDESVISKITFKGLFGDRDSVKDEEKLEQVGDIEAPASVTSAKYAPSVEPSLESSLKASSRTSARSPGAYSHMSLRTPLSLQPIMGPPISSREVSSLAVKRKPGFLPSVETSSRTGLVDLGSTYDYLNDATSVINDLEDMSLLTESYAGSKYGKNADPTIRLEDWDDTSLAGSVSIRVRSENRSHHSSGSRSRHHRPAREREEERERGRERHRHDEDKRRRRKVHRHKKPRSDEVEESETQDIESFSRSSRRGRSTRSRQRSRDKYDSESSVGPGAASSQERLHLSGKAVGFEGFLPEIDMNEAETEAK